MKQNEEESTACQGQKIAEEPSGKNWAEIPRDCQKPGVLRTCNKAGMRLRQLKRNAQKTQGTKNRYIFISLPMM